MSHARAVGRCVVLGMLGVLASASVALGQDAFQTGDDMLRMQHKLSRRHKAAGQQDATMAATETQPVIASVDVTPPDEPALEPDELLNVLNALRADVEMVRKIRQAEVDKTTGDATSTNLRTRLQAEIAARLKEAVAEKDEALRCQLLDEVHVRLQRLVTTLSPAKPDDAAIQRLKAAAENLKKWLADGAPADDFDKLRAALNDVLVEPPSEWRIVIATSAAQHEALSDASRVDVAAYLADAHTEYHAMIEVVHRCKLDATCKNRIDDVELALAKLDGSVHAAMDKAGLRRPFTGALSVATGFSRVGDGKADTATAQAALVRFESRHVRLSDVDGNDRLHVAIAGMLGIKPAFTMVKPKATSFTDVGALRVVPVDPEHTGAGDSFDLIATTDSGPLKRRCKKDAQGAFVGCETDPVTPVAKFQPAFVWDLGLRAGIPIRNRGELGGFWHGGQTFVTSEATVVDTAKPPALGITAGDGSAARFYNERGFHLAIFRDGRSASHELSVLRPVFEATYAWRYDNRFRNQDDLKPFSKEFGTRPHRRRVLRLALSGLPVFGDKDTPFSLSFAIDHEWANGTGLPGGTRVYVQGDLDLLKLFK